MPLDRRNRTRPEEQRRHPWPVVALAAVVVSCFNGADAQGLPCLSDADCGVSQSCTDGFCGGAPATSSAGSSDSSSSTGSSSSSDSLDSSSGSMPGCGNGIVDAEIGEECDPGEEGESADCNADCTATLCGDGYVNAAAGEQCDDGNETSIDDCTPDCMQTLFWDDMEQQPAMTQKWMPQIPEWDYMGAPFELAAGWIWGVPEPGVWHSGPYSPDAGTARIITRPIEFPAGLETGFRYELRFRYRLRFDGNPNDLQGTECEPLNGDGGVVLIQEGMMLRPAGPPMGHPEVLDNDGGCVTVPTNPLYDAMMPRPAYTGISPMNEMLDAVLPLPGVEGTTVELVFEVGYDCDNCWGDEAPVGAGWTVDDVVVAAFPT